MDDPSTFVNSQVHITYTFSLKSKVYIIILHPIDLENYKNEVKLLKVYLVTFLMGHKYLETYDQID